MKLSTFWRIHAVLAILAIMVLILKGVQNSEEFGGLWVVLLGVYGLFLLAMLCVALGNLLGVARKRSQDEMWGTPREKVIREILMWHEMGEAGQVRRRLEELRDVIPGFSEEVKEAGEKLLGTVENLVATASKKEREDRIKELQKLLARAEAIEKEYASSVE